MPRNIWQPFFFGIFFLIVTGCTKTVNTSSTATEPGLAYSSSNGGGSSSNPGGGTNSPGVITAGEWNDLDNWSFWLGLMDTIQWKDKQDYWKIFPNNRYTVQLTDKAGNNIIDAPVIMKDSDGNITWTGKTDNAGKAELFFSLFNKVNNGPFANANNGIYSAVAVVDGASTDLGIFPSSHLIKKQLNVLRPASNTADIMYVVDATGSMGDELSYLQNELNDVLTRSQSELPGVNIRSAGVFYRDEGDEYLTKVSPFSTDIHTLVNFVKAQTAGGGGDFPEAVHTALETAINQQSWSNNATCRLLFLILDAPPHHENAVIQSIQSSVKKAAEKGIKIIPITASGIDKDTEFIMRFMSISTNGTYVFITNDSGIGNTHLSPTVGKFQVEYLNNLMLRLVKKYSNPN